MKPVKNLILDLGGVLLTLDYSKTEKAFVDLGVADFAGLYSQQKASPLFEDLETGKISNDQFYSSFRSLAEVSLTDEQMGNAWCSMLGHFPDEVLRWLAEIKSRYNLYLFSNTNRIHHNAFQKIYRQQTGQANFDDFFIKAWYSHDLGLRKPYPEAYTKLLEIEALDAEDTLFIDDSEVNIIGAQKARLQTIWLKPPAKVWELGL